MGEKPNIPTGDTKMHTDEIYIDLTLVKNLLVTQFPHWADLAIRPVESSGTDNAIYRLGDSLAIRLPRIPGATRQVAKEQLWLPKLAPQLPLAIPTPVAKGRPGEGYPWEWSIYTWLEGQNAITGKLTDPGQAAVKLAQFLTVLHQIDSIGDLPPGEHNFSRGIPLAKRDEATRAAIAELHQRSILTSTVIEAVKAVWNAALQAAVWDGPPIWIHGDLQAGNLLIQDGKLSGVIDFGGLAQGDPACDLLIAWDFFSAETRAIFRNALAVDDAMWARGRGWALSVALIALPYYLNSSPLIASRSQRTIAETIADWQHN